MARKPKSSEAKTTPTKTEALKPAALKTETPKPARAKRAAKAPAVSIDFPTQDEGIESDSYTFRIATPLTADRVEVSIDRGPWLACRPSVGFWWYDWSGFAPGVHRLTARVVIGTEATAISAQRRFQTVGRPS